MLALTLGYLSKEEWEAHEFSEGDDTPLHVTFSH
jgi:hypothetical protein